MAGRVRVNRWAQKLFSARLHSMAFLAGYSDPNECADEMYDTLLEDTGGKHNIAKKARDWFTGKKVPSDDGIGKLAEFFSSRYRNSAGEVFEVAAIENGLLGSESEFRSFIGELAIFYFGDTYLTHIAENRIGEESSLLKKLNGCWSLFRYHSHNSENVVCEYMEIEHSSAHLGRCTLVTCPNDSCWNGTVYPILNQQRAVAILGLSKDSKFHTLIVLIDAANTDTKGPFAATVCGFTDANDMMAAGRGLLCKNGEASLGELNKHQVYFPGEPIHSEYKEAISLNWSPENSNSHFVLTTTHSALTRLSGLTK